MAELHSDDVYFREQQVKFLDELKRPVLAYLQAAGKITPDQRYTDRLTPVKEQGFELETGLTSQAVASMDLFNFNFPKKGRLTLKKNFQDPCNMNNSNTSNYQQDCMNHASFATSNNVAIPDLSRLLSDDEQCSFKNNSSNTNLPSFLKAEEQITDAAVSPETLSLPKPSIPDFKCSYELKYYDDKNAKLIIRNSKKIELRIIDGCKIMSMRTKSGRYDVFIDFEISMGARTEETDVIVCQVNEDSSLNVNNFFVLCKMNVLIINSLECYKDEIYVRGQMGPSEDLVESSKELRRKKIKVATFIRKVSFFGFVFEVDFYGYYVYRIVGKIFYDNAGSLPDQWPWHNAVGMPIDSPLNTDDIVSYEVLRDGIYSIGDFFTIFSNATQGMFCNPIHGLINKRILQLCLVLVFSEVIRNFETIEWNSALLNEQFYFQCVDDLKEAIRHHPMVASGSFQKRRTGFYGGTAAANRRVNPYEKFLEQIRRTNN